MTPRIRNNSEYRLNIPALSGGLNCRDGVALIQDNQMTDCLNMWFKEGMLQTRFGMGENKYYPHLNVYGSMKKHDVYKTVTAKNSLLYKEHSDYGKTFTERCRLISLHYPSGGSEIRFFWLGENLLVPISSIYTSEDTNYFTVQQDDKIYCFVSFGENQIIYQLQAAPTSSAVQHIWEALAAEDLYIPTVYTNGKMTGSLSYTSDTKTEVQTSEYIPQADMLDDFNLLGDYFRAYYSTVNKDLMRNGVEHCPMRYEIPVEFDGSGVCAGKTVTVKITDKNGKKVTHTATFDEFGTSAIEGSFNPADDLEMYVSYNEIVFYEQYQSQNRIRLLEESDYVRNNMEIIFPMCYTAGERDKVFKMSRHTWFGGSSEGISGGTRLFLCGNSRNKNLVMWSDIENPLYFPEHNCFGVGETGESVTGFGKQSDMLIIFKPSETYYTQYTQADSATAQQVMNQDIVGLASSGVYFPLCLINSTIGCDLPDTVQLCRNRLVWCDSSGRVYTLTNNNQYSERNIFEVGEMIYDKLKLDTDINNAESADFEGHYILHTAGGRMYVLDYNSYGYNNVASYSKNEDANVRIPWYYFELTPQGVTSSLRVFMCGQSLIYICKRSEGLITGEISSDYKTDEILESNPPTSENVFPILQNIPCRVQTKVFDFGEPAWQKNIQKVELTFGNNGAQVLNVAVITENGREDSIVVIDEKQSGEIFADFFTDRLIRPKVRGNKRAAIEISSDSGLYLGALAIQFKKLGGIKK